MSFLSGISKKPVGTSPGTAVYVGRKRDDPVGVSLIRYSSVGAEPPRVVPLEQCKHEGVGDGVSWYTIDGIHDVRALSILGENFKLHPLVIEDIVNTTQRPKLEEFEGYLFITVKMIVYNRKESRLRSEHVSLVCGEGYVLSFLEDAGDVFEPIRQRIASGRGQIRKNGSGYLLYALLDAIVDYYFQVIEELGEVIEALEEEVVANPSPATLRGIHRIKRELIVLRRSVWPMREIVNVLLREETPLISKGTRVFLRDLYDHTIQVADTVETLRDIMSSALDVYLSSVSNRLNEVMKVLTVMSSIFIPLTFIVGIYGMNFDYMPELRWRYGYPTLVGFMAILSLFLLAFFKRKRWL